MPALTVHARNSQKIVTFDDMNWPKTSMLPRQSLSRTARSSQASVRIGFLQRQYESSKWSDDRHNFIPHLIMNCWVRTNCHSKDITSYVDSTFLLRNQTWTATSIKPLIPHPSRLLPSVEDSRLWPAPKPDVSSSSVAVVVYAMRTWRGLSRCKFLQATGIPGGSSPWRKRKKFLLRKFFVCVRIWKILRLMHPEGAPDSKGEIDLSGVENAQFYKEVRLLDFHRYDVSGDAGILQSHRKRTLLVWETR